jgi:hypothetical protein
MTFELLLDKYRKDLLNMTIFEPAEEQYWYWKKRSDDTYRRLIEMHNEANNRGR